MKIARVNSKEISEKEFMAELYQLMRSQNEAEASVRLQTRALTSLIDACLLLEESQKFPLEINEQEALQKFHEMQKGYSSQNEFKRDLKKHSVTSQKILENIRNNLRIKKFIQTNFSPENRLTENQLKDYYIRNRENFKKKERVHILHLLISKKCNNAEEKVKKVEKKIENRVEFREIVNKYSDCPSAKKNGDLGYVPRGKFIAELEQVAFSRTINQVVGPVKSQFGYHFMKILDKKPAKIAKFEEIKDSLKEQLEKISSEIELLKFIRTCREKATIKINHRFHELTRSIEKNRG